MKKKKLAPRLKLPSVGIHNKCSHCDAAGMVQGLTSRNVETIQKCAYCNLYATDEEAADVALLLFRLLDAELEKGGGSVAEAVTRMVTGSKISDCEDKQCGSCLVCWVSSAVVDAVRLLK